MAFMYFALCAFLFALGDYVCSLQGESGFRLLPALGGAAIGSFGYFLFAYLSTTTPLAALAAFINGAVVILSCVVFGAMFQGNRLSLAEWLCVFVIFCGIVGLGLVRR